MFKMSSFNGRPCARWLGWEEAALVVGALGVTPHKFGRLIASCLRLDCVVSWFLLCRNQRTGNAKRRRRVGLSGNPCISCLQELHGSGRLENIFYLLVCTRAWPPTRTLPYLRIQTKL